MNSDKYRKCAVPNCGRKGADGYTLHKAPENKERYMKWEAFLCKETGNKEMTFLGKRFFLCEMHFEKKYYSFTGRFPRLLPNSVPTIHSSGYKESSMVFTPEKAMEGIIEPVSSTIPSPTFSPFMSSTPISIPQPDLKPTCATQLFPPTSSSLGDELAVPLVDDVLDKETADNSSSCNVTSSDTLILTAKQGRGKHCKNRGKTLLRQLGFGRRSKLTPKKKLLFNAVNIQRKKFKRLQNKFESNKIKLKDILRESDDSISFFKSLSSSLSKASAIFIGSQLRCAKQKPKGRRWSTEEKILALSLLKRSPKAYVLLSTIFVLPTPRTLVSLLNRIPLEAGINSHIFNSLKKSVSRMQKGDRICSLMFDEMAIREHIQFDPRGGRFVGFTNLGSGRGCKKTLANHSLVFMLRGLRRKWKQPIAHYFTNSGISGSLLAELILEVVAACEEAGVIVVCTVCDMGASNVKALDLLGSSNEEPYFKFGSRKIVTMFDVPHLLKCTRNMLFRNAISMPVEIGGSTSNFQASWSHILGAYEMDSNQVLFQHLHKLTSSHLNPVGQSAMKVSFAAQVLSHTMAATINTGVSHNQLPPEALGTAKFCGFINKLFDSLNGTSLTPGGSEGMRCSIKLGREMLHLNFWKEAIMEIDSWRYFQKKNRGGEVHDCLICPPSQKGWIITLRGVMILWDILKTFGFNYLQLRSLNQDAIEHLFGSIRFNCGSNRNPTVTQFVAALKTTIINGLIKHDLKGANCEDEDSGSVLNNMQEFLCPQSDSSVNDCIVDHQEHNVDFIQCLDLDEGYNDIATINNFSLPYVTGYIGRKILSNGNCNNCRTILSMDSRDGYSLTGITYREYSDVNSGLFYPSQSLIKYVWTATTISKKLLSEMSHLGSVKNTIVATIKRESNDNWLKEGCPEHHNVVSDAIINLVCKIYFRWWCINVNRGKVENYKKVAWRRKLKILSHK